MTCSYWWLLDDFHSSGHILRFKPKISDSATTLFSAIFGCNCTKSAAGEHTSLCFQRPRIWTTAKVLFSDVSIFVCDSKIRTKFVLCKPGLSWLFCHKKREMSFKHLQTKQIHTILWQNILNVHYFYILIHKPFKCIICTINIYFLLWHLFKQKTGVSKVRP